MRRYDVRNGTRFPYGAHFTYHTVTVGGWQGTIGRLRATLILEDGLTAAHLAEPRPDCPDSLRNWYSNDSDWSFVAPDRLVLEWTDFDPWLDARKRSFEFDWEPLLGEETDPYEVLFREEDEGSRWWPRNWFRR